MAPVAMMRNILTFIDAPNWRVRAHGQSPCYSKPRIADPPSKPNIVEMRNP
jgi:hypothetical protein